MRLLVLGIGQLLTFAGADKPRRGKEMSSTGLTMDAAVLVEDGRILAAGIRDTVLAHEKAGSARILDAGGRVVLPGFVDSHTHPVFAGPRLKDFEERLKGKSYADLAAEGGGILSTVNAVRGTKEADLAAAFKKRAQLFLESGTTTIEAKSGYGLDLDNELKLLRVMRAVSEQTPLEVVSTVLGAHAIPPELKNKKDDYVRRVCEEMIPAAAKGGLARFADIFVEKDYFTLEDAGRVFEAASTCGLGIKIHAEQLSRSGSVVSALRAGAVSADHLDHVNQDDINALAVSQTIACLVPGSNYFLAKPYPPARRLIDGGAAVALATDFNPGTCPCWDMRQILSIACTQMKMSPAEALCAATINGAWALGLGKTHGSIEPGKKADLVCWDARDYRAIPYYFGAPEVVWTMKAGKVVVSREGLKL